MKLLINYSIMLSLLMAMLLIPTIGVDAVEDIESYDIVIVGGTPGGIMSAIAAARLDCSVVILERSQHIGGLPANGLGATDIATRGATGGLFKEFVNRVLQYYIDTYGKDSIQVKDCSQGYHFEPRIAELIFEQMLAEHPDKITVKRMRQFDALPENTTLKDGRLSQIKILNRTDKTIERYAAQVFMDATYEGDLAAAAGASYRLGREDQREFNEPMAGKLYKPWIMPAGPGSTGLGDNAVQSYNYRLCLTRNVDNMVKVQKPENYNRDEYISLIDDVKLGRFAGAITKSRNYNDIWRITNMVGLPNQKTDANNQHAAFISTDLPEENWPWPTASWDWRDRYAQRLRDYTLGLVWFIQHDADLPEDVRSNCIKWGLAKDEYVDNDNFPRQVYIREGRRIVGDHLFTAHDALPVSEGARPPIYKNSITASHYNLDSHAVLKREPGRVHLDGFFSYKAYPYTVPYGVIIPQKVEGLMIPVPVSGTHIGFSTLRMEPCWMAMGHAAGTAAAISIKDGVAPRRVDSYKLQNELLKQGSVLIYFRDANPGDPHFEALQFFALRGFLGNDQWDAKLNDTVDSKTANQWIKRCGVKMDYDAGTTRGELLGQLYDYVKQLPDSDIEQITSE